jgi:hypothetical protein
MLPARKGLSLVMWQSLRPYISPQSQAHRNRTHNPGEPQITRIFSVVIGRATWPLTCQWTAADKRTCHFGMLDLCPRIRYRNECRRPEKGAAASLLDSHGKEHGVQGSKRGLLQCGCQGLHAAYTERSRENHDGRFSSRLVCIGKNGLNRGTSGPADVKISHAI